MMDHILTIHEIRDILRTKPYDFLRTNTYVVDKVMLLTLGGSYAYGTCTEDSDIDIRGIVVNPVSDIIGINNYQLTERSPFKAFVDSETDTKLYSFQRMIKLLSVCNPETIEMLGCRKDHYIHLTSLGQNILDNRHMFLSKRAANSFGGFADAQLRRLECMMLGDRMPQGRLEEHMNNSIHHALQHMQHKFSSYDGSGITTYTDISNKPDLEREVFADINLKHFPVRDFNSIINELTNIVGTYGKMNTRNTKKDEYHMNKHAMHLIRLYLMGIDILEKEEIITYRADEHDLLMNIRNGYYTNPDETFNDAFFQMVDYYSERFKYANNHTSLPPYPDVEEIDAFVQDTNYTTIGQGGCA